MLLSMSLDYKEKVGSLPCSLGVPASFQEQHEDSFMSHFGRKGNLITDCYSQQPLPLKKKSAANTYTLDDSISSDTEMKNVSLFCFLTFISK